MILYTRKYLTNILNNKKYLSNIKPSDYVCFYRDVIHEIKSMQNVSARVIASSCYCEFIKVLSA